MSEVCSIAVIGAGSKGREIALLALLAGYRVVLEDMSSSRLDQSKTYISVQLDEAIEHGDLQPSRRSEIAAKFLITQSMDEASRSGDLLVDAAPEDAELQLEIFTIFDKFARPEAILATTATSVSVADLAEMTNCQERCVGLRFPERTSEDRHVIIVRAPKTSECTVQACAIVAARMGLKATISSEPVEPNATERESQPR